MHAHVMVNLRLVNISLSVVLLKNRAFDYQKHPFLIHQIKTKSVAEFQHIYV